jgi:hypothetical protein
MIFDQLFVDYYHQLDETESSSSLDGYMKSLLVSSFLGDYEIFTIIDNIPLSIYLDDFIKLFDDDISIISREMIDINLLTEIMSYYIQI